MTKYLIIALLFISLCIHAKQINIEYASKVAEAFYAAQSNTSNYKISDFYIESVESINTFYIFSFLPSGYVIISADNVVKPIIGYSVTGNFDKDNLPPQFKGWLKSCSASIKREITMKDNLPPDSEWEEILSGNKKKVKYLVLPLCTTGWDQSCYYNELCPYDTLGPCDHTVTGCVATAMAQIMKYWNYPSKGQGTHSYISTWFGNLYANFGATSYNWSAMPDYVSSTNMEVATLMFHCGVSVEMDYYATSSGSNNYFALSALPNYFKYSSNTTYVYKSNYTDSTWIELIKKELDAGRPVLYSGKPDTVWMNGHSWVCDGYDNNNFLHFNWGWGAGFDGYFETGNFYYHNNNEVLIKIMPIVSCDIALTDFMSPVSATFTSPSTIKVKISNYDTLARSNIPVSYMIDGGTPVNEIISLPLAALSDTIYEFAQTYDFSSNPGHVYDIKVYSALSCDGYKENDTLSVLIENVACEDIPYSTGFETSENLNGWLFKDENNDGNSWNYGTGGNIQPGCVNYAGNTLQASDWLISKCIQLEPNKMYKLSYFYKSTGQYWPQKLDVYIGNDQEIANLTTFLTGDTNIVNSVYQKEEVYFTVAASGSYYFGWHCYSDSNMLALSIDDINIEEQTAIDVGIVSTTLPEKSCDLQQENVEVLVQNYCSTILNNIPISYSVNGSAVVNETIATAIPVGGTLTYTFTTPVDLSASGQYIIEMYTSLANDTLLNNDTLIANVSNSVSITPVYTMGFEPTEDFSGWEIFNNNNDSYEWTVQNSGGSSQPYCMRYDYSSWIAADDWFVTSCIDLDATETYKLSFWYKAESNQWPEKLEVSIGNGQETGLLTTSLLDFPNIINQSYQLAEVEFSIPIDGFYYIGWHCYSDALMFNLYVDDISIDIVTRKNNNVNGFDYHIYPNPTTGKILISSEGMQSVELYNLQGKSLLKSNVNTDTYQIDISDFTEGIYFVEVATAQGVITEKIILY